MTGKALTINWIFWDEIVSLSNNEKLIRLVDDKLIEKTASGSLAHSLRYVKYSDFGIRLNKKHPFFHIKSIGEFLILDLLSKDDRLSIFEGVLG